MSDWEPAARNAMKKALPNSELYGCWFHFTQRIWAKTQNVGLAQEFRNNQDIECYIKQLMAIPYLPSSLINPTYTCLQMPSLDTSDPNMIKLQKLKKYFKKRWLSQIEPGELSVYNLNIATNNAAERATTRGVGTGGAGGALAPPLFLGLYLALFLKLFLSLKSYRYAEIYSN